MPYWLKKFWDLPKNNFVKGPFNPRQKVMWASTLSPFSLTGCLSISMLCLQIVWVFSLVFTQWPSVGSLDLAVFSSCKMLLIKISFPGLVAFMLAETSYYNVSANSINLQGYQAKKRFFSSTMAFPDWYLPVTEARSICICLSSTLSLRWGDLLHILVRRNAPGKQMVVYVDQRLAGSRIFDPRIPGMGFWWIPGSWDFSGRDWPAI